MGQQGMALRSIGMLAVCALALAGCSALKGTGAGAVLAMLKGKGDQPSATAIPRSELEKAGIPLILVRNETFGTEAFIGPRDSRGTLVNWATADGILLTLRDGVLIETRGFGGDLMSSAMPGIGQVLAGGSHRRSYFYTGPDDKIFRLDVTCSTQVAGSETLAIYGLAYPTRHLVETCRGDGAELQNEYWMQGGLIRQSREWISPTLGYVELTRVID